MRQVAQLLLMCDRQDIGISIGGGDETDGKMGSEVIFRGHSDPSSVVSSKNDLRPHFPDEPRVFIYDNYPGGIGFSEPLFRMHAELLSRTHELIAGCECEHGCPTCVGPVGNTGPLAKVVALRILDQLGAQSTGRLEAGVA